MSFTEDELEAFNSVLEKRFTAHRQEMEQALDQRLKLFQQELEQRFGSLQEEFALKFKQGEVQEQERLGEEFLTHQQTQLEQIVKMITQEAEQKQRLTEAAVDRMLAAQLLGMEQLLNQQTSLQGLDADALVQSLRPRLEAMELQTELPWEELTEVVGKSLDSRLDSLSDSLQRSLQGLEQYIALRLHGLRDELALNLGGNGQAYNGHGSNGSSMQEILDGIGHLERIVESMQVAMTANHALLSNRLYHHQQLPLERAHPVGFSPATQVRETSSLLAQAKERIAHGQEPGLPIEGTSSEEE
ncbi:MAG TPA: hypothetical protein VFN35_34260 [Ktedonobacteraceae bacterium]|nr:hypothetical protein [Ktedonobacteraceae bacterium]